MSPRASMGLAAAGSAILLLGAYGFEALGYAPCRMCLWQRWPHFGAVAVGLIAVLLGWRALGWLGAALAATTAGIGLFHTGVERDWWEGPTSCTGGGAGLGGLPGSDLLSTEAPRVVMCDEVSWAFLGLSMASWNAILSLLLVGLWVAAATRPPTPKVSEW